MSWLKMATPEQQGVRCSDAGRPFVPGGKPYRVVTRSWRRPRPPRCGLMRPRPAPVPPAGRTPPVGSPLRFLQVTPAEVVRPPAGNPKEPIPSASGESEGVSPPPVHPRTAVSGESDGVSPRTYHSRTAMRPARWARAAAGAAAGAPRDQMPGPSCSFRGSHPLSSAVSHADPPGSFSCAWRRRGHCASGRGSAFPHPRSSGFPPDCAGS